jgi:hypothetical protein
MPTTLHRESLAYTPITLTNSVSTTTGFSLNIAAGAMLLVDSKSTAGNVTITFFVKTDERFPETYQVLDAFGAAVTRVVTANNQAVALPDELFAARFVLCVLSSGTATVRYVTKG